MPAVVMDFLGFVPYASHTWTIGAEEQFYFLWPVLIKKYKNKFAVIAGVMAIYISIHYALYFFGANSIIGRNLFLLWTRYPINCMAIGGAYACVAFTKNNFCLQLQKKLFNVWLQVLVYIVLIVFIINQVHLSHFNNEVYSVLLGYLVFNMAANPKPLFNIENKVFNYFGTISFGLYMFHPVGIVTAIRWCLYINCPSVLLLYITSIVFTAILAVVSYHLYEIFFIKKKAAFSVVPGGK
jgi:peptidoglycan/LPS O-acetylase OafA/YrhL